MAIPISFVLYTRIIINKKVPNCSCCNGEIICFKGLSECAQAQIAFKSEFVTNTVAFGESIGNLLPPVRV